MILKHYKPMQPRIKWFKPIKINPTRVEELQPAMPKFKTALPSCNPQVMKEESTSSDEDQKTTIKFTETLSLSVIVQRLKQERFSKVKLIYKGGQGATFRVFRGNTIYCLKLFLFCDNAKLEYNYWD